MSVLEKGWLMRKLIFKYLLNVMFGYTIFSNLFLDIRPSLMGVMLDFQLVLLYASMFCNSEACFRKKFFPKLSDFVKIRQFLKISKISKLCLHFWKSILNHRKPSRIKIFFRKINTKTRRFLLCDQTELMVSWSWDSQPENLAGV